jgi:hypothetical protein
MEMELDQLVAVIAHLQGTAVIPQIDLDAVTVVDDLERSLGVA